MDNKVIDTATVETTENETVKITEKAYTFRTLEATDAFLMFKILGKIGINEFADIFGKENVQKVLTGKENVTNLVTSVGISVAFEGASVILRNIDNCRADIFQLLANTTDLTVNQVAKLDFVTFAEMIIDFVKKPEFKDFIKVVSGLFK